MMNKPLVWFCAMLFLTPGLTLLSAAADAPDPKSPQRAPTLIYNVNDLQNMSNGLSGDYALANDINASATSGWNGGAGFYPIGIGTSFGGNFDGRGYNITGLYIARAGTSYIGLFAVTNSAAKIKNVNLLNVKVSGDQYVGGLVGSFSSSAISGCNVSGSVNGYILVGGLIGCASGGTVTACSSAGSVSGTGYVGGLVGTVQSATVSSCYSTSSATGDSRIGGAIGYNYGGTVFNCYSTGPVSGSLEFAAGLIGHMIYGRLYNSYSTSQVTGYSCAGGLAGYFEQASMTRCYATGAVSGYVHVAGLIGSAYWDNEYESYATGPVSGTTEVGGLIGTKYYGGVSNCYSRGWVKGTSWVGGLMGYAYSVTMSNSFWDVQTSGLSYSNGGTGKTTKEMMAQTTFTNWDFSNTWGVFEKTTYPYLRWRYPSAVMLSGTAYKDGGNDPLGSGAYVTVVDNFGYSVAHFETRTDYTGQYRQIVDRGAILTALWDKWAKGTSYGIEASAQSYSLDIYNRTIFAKGNIGKNITVRDMVATAGKYRSDLISPLQLSSQGLAFETGYPLVTADGTIFETDRNLTITGGADMRFGGRFAQTKGVLLTAGNITFNAASVVAGNLALNCTGDIVFREAFNAGSFTIINARDCNVMGVLSAGRFTQLAGTGVTDFSEGRLELGAGDASITANRVVGQIITAALSLAANSADLTGLINGSFGRAGADQIELLHNIKLGTHFFDGFDLYKFTPEDLTIATEDVPYSVDYEPMDPSETLTWTLDTDAGWLTLDATTGVLSGTPDNSDVGRYHVEVTAHDGPKSLARGFDLEVVNVNDPPEIMTTDVKTAIEDKLYEVVYSAVDIDPTQDVLVWSLESNASWLKLDMNRLWGNPTNDDAGQYWAKVTVSDGHGGTDSTNFTLTVENVNDLPVITTIPPSVAVEDSAFNFTFAAEDEDAGEELTWALNTTAGWLSIDAASGVLSGTPSNEDVGSAWVTVTVTDNEGATGSVGFMLTIQNANDQPAWVTVPADQNITEGDELYLDAMATDVDRGDVIRYSVSTDPASGLIINMASGTLRWTRAMPGNYTVTLTASDGKATNTTTFKITVNKLPPPVVPPANKPPQITAPTVTPAKVGQAFTCKLNGSDADAWDKSNLTFRLVSGPAGMMVSADGNILWIPAKDQAGSYTVVVSLTDGKNTATTTFTVEARKPGVAATSAAGGYNEGWLAAMLFLGLFIGVVVILLMGRRPPKAEAAIAPSTTYAAPAATPPVEPAPPPPAPMPALPPPEQPAAAPPPPMPAPAPAKPPVPEREFKP